MLQLKTPGPIVDYRRDRSGWAEKLLRNEKHTSSQNIVCHKYNAREDYLPDCQLPYGR